MLGEDIFLCTEDSVIHCANFQLNSSAHKESNSLPKTLLYSLQLLVSKKGFLRIFFGVGKSITGLVTPNVASAALSAMHYCYPKDVDWAKKKGGKEAEAARKSKRCVTRHTVNWEINEKREESWK